MAASVAQLARHLQRLKPPGPETEPDAALLDRFVRRRDEEAFAALVARHGPMVWRLCRRTLADAHAAEDSFQATFFVLATRAGSIRQSDSLAAWLYGVASRVARKARARGMRRRRSEEPGSSEAADPRPDPLAELSARELLDAVEEEVRRLPEAYRLPVLLCCLEGRTREEAAALLGWSEGSVKGRLERGRARLHARLARRGLTLSAALAAAELSRGTVPAACVGPTVRGALHFAAGAGVASGAGELAKGVVRAMVLTRIKAVAALLLAVAVLGLGAGGVARQLRAVETEPDRASRSAPPGDKPQAAPKDAFAISYGHAGLTSLTVEKGKLHYSWATRRKPRSGKPGPERQSMESYDLHKATIWLTEAEEKKFREWVTRHKVFDFKGEYKSASGGRSYGAAFQSGLTVTAGGRKHGIAWVGDSKTPETLNAAVSELLSLAAAVEKDRRQ